MKYILLFIIGLLFSNCAMQSYSPYYNTLQEYSIVVKDKRYIPGFQHPDKYQLKVLEGDEYRWIATTKAIFDAKQKNDTINCILLTMDF